jgi:hypothetical protein
MFRSFGSTANYGTRHIAYRVWPLVESSDMQKETTAESSEGGLVRLKYTFRFRNKFDEPNDDWLKCIEATSEELIGTYSKAEDDALSTAFGGRGKKRLNRVFDAIGFVYPDYHYPLRTQGKKRKTAALAITAVPKGKKIKVLTHQPRYIELVVVPEFGEGTSSNNEAKQAAPIVQSAEESIVVPKVPTVRPAKDDAVEESKLEKNSENARNSEPTSKGRIAEGAKGSCRDSQEEENGQRARRYHGDHKGLEPCSYQEGCELSKSRPEPKLGLQCPLK